MRIPPPVVETVQIDRLRPWTRNPRKDHAVDAIAQSMRTFGYVCPIVVQAHSYRVIAGHGRLEALKKIGATAVPVIVVDMDDNRADLYTIADNKLAALSDWDFATLADLLLELDQRNHDTALTGFDDGELETIMNWSRETESGGFEMTVRCRTAIERDELVERLIREGYEAKGA